jgi:hypothetical protein
MFCGECGRAAGPRAVPAPGAKGAARAATGARPATAPLAGTTGGSLSPDVDRPAPSTTAMRDTVALDRNWLSAEFEYAPVMVPAAEPVVEPEHVSAEHVSAEPAVAVPADLDPSAPDTEAPDTHSPATDAPDADAPDADAPDTDSSHPDARETEVAESLVADRSAIHSAPPVIWDAPVPSPRVAAPIAAYRDDAEDNELTRIVPRRGAGVRFVLQFSTGESVVVSGTGLLGRNPIAEPGEAFEDLVPITDPGKSVSKTHLEFGQEQGAFWILDRYSANGSVIREPNVAPRRCEPGRRYRVTRGARVDIGEQFVVVS